MCGWVRAWVRIWEERRRKIQMLAPSTGVFVWRMKWEMRT
jgi:hypothetical protein